MKLTIKIIDQYSVYIHPVQGQISIHHADRKPDGLFKLCCEESGYDWLEEGLCAFVVSDNPETKLIPVYDRMGLYVIDESGNTVFALKPVKKEG